VFPGIADGPEDFPQRMERLVAFLNAGFRAPVPVARASEEK
jgi:hypothetical protein